MAHLLMAPQPSDGAGPAGHPKLGRTRCYWAILTPSLEFAVVDPVLETHLGDEVHKLMGTSLLEYAHPDDRDPMRNDLLGSGGNGLYGSVTQCRYARVATIRQMLGCKDPYWAPEAAIYALSDNQDYLALQVTTSWIGLSNSATSPGAGGAAEGEGTPKGGAVLAFFHACTDFDPVQDNDPTKRSEWSNWCGPKVEAGPYLTPVHCAQMSGALERIAAPAIQPGWDLPPPEDPQHVFQVLDHQGKPIVSSPTPTELGRPLGTAGMALYYAEELAGLVREVLADPNKFDRAARSHTNCTQRFKLDRTVVLSQGVMKRVKGSIISYGAVTFVAFDLETAGPVAQGAGASPLPTGKRSLDLAVSDDAKRARPNGQDPYAQHQHSGTPPFSTNGHPAQPAPFNPHALNPAYPQHHNQQHIDPSLRSQPTPPPSSGQYAPGQPPRINPALQIVAGQARAEGQALSPTVASASAILGSFSTGPPGSAQDGAFPLSPQHGPGQPQGSRPPSAPPVGHSQAPGQYGAYAPSGLGQQYGQQQGGAGQYAGYPGQPSTSAAYSLPPPAGGQYAYAGQPGQPPQFHPGYNYAQGMQPTSAQQPLPYPSNGQSQQQQQQQYYQQLQQQQAYPSQPHSQLPQPSHSPAPSHAQPTPSPHSATTALPPQSDAAPAPAPPAKPNGGGRAKSSEGGAPVRESKPSATGQACESCGTETSPEWRKGPSGTKSLCNACGLRYARQVARKNKLEKQKEAGGAGGEEAGGGKGKKGKKGGKAAGASASASATPAPEASDGAGAGADGLLDPALGGSPYGGVGQGVLDPSLQGAGAGGAAAITSHPYYPAYPPVHTVVGELKEGAQEPIPYGSEGGDIQVNPQ